MASFDLFLTVNTCISVTVFAELFVEVMGSNVNDANPKTWLETFFVEDSETFTKRDWTNVDDNPYWNKQIVELGTRADPVNRLLWLIFAYWNKCKACWETASTAGELWVISFSYCTGCLSNPGSDFSPWHSPRERVFWVTVALLERFASCLDNKLYLTRFVERTLESYSAFHSNLRFVVWSFIFIRSLVGSQVGTQIGLIVGLLFDASN